MDNYRQRILQLVEACPEYDLKSLSMAIGRSHSYLHQFIHRGSPRRLNGDDRRKLAMLLKVNEQRLMPDDESADDLRAVALYERGGDLMQIPVYDVVCSAGNGAVIDAEQIMYHMPFNANWLRGLTSAPLERLAVIRVEGDSMQPTLSHDDVVLLDMTQTQPKCDGIYVVFYDDTLLVKRLRVDPVRQMASILSDNPLYAPVDGVKPADIRTAGRVIWLGRRV